MQTGRWTPTASHPQGVHCEQSSLIGIRIQQGIIDIARTSQNRRRVIMNPFPRKNEHKEWTCSSFGSFRGSIHPDRFAILPVLFTFKWSGHWSRPLKTAYLLLGFNHNYGKKTKITHVSMVYLVTCHSYGICFMCRLLIDDLPIVYLYKSMFADDLVILMEMFADGLPLYTCTYTHKNI